MGGIPNPKIQKFETGNLTKDFTVTIHLIVKERCQVRHSALEAARITCNRHLVKRLGRVGYHLKIRVYPHNVLRENKLATGAGADRISQGMSEAFGKLVGTAARVKPDQEIITVSVDADAFPIAKDALRKASMKIPSPCQIIVAKGKELLPGI